MSALPRGYAELERRDRRMFRRLIDTAIFAGDHLKDAHDWVRELPDLQNADQDAENDAEDDADGADDESPVGGSRDPAGFTEAGPLVDPLPGPPRRALSVPDVGHAADPFVPAAGAEAIPEDPVPALAMRVALAAAFIAVAAALVAAIL